MNIPIPPAMLGLPFDPVRKLPIPWFVAWVDGRPEFRVADGAKHTLAIRERRCWVCGLKLDNRATYVIGPMCSINRITAEPPCHPDCAVYSARACPFLARPEMVRRETALPQGTQNMPGDAIMRNPGVTCLWTGRTPGSRLLRVDQGVLFALLPPLSVSWWAEGRAATRAEVDHAVETGLPRLLNMAEAEGPESVEKFRRMHAEAIPLFDLAGGDVTP